MKRNALTLILALLVVLPASAVPAAAAGPPNVNVYVNDRTLEPGTVNTLTVTVANEHSDTFASARPASDVRVNVKSGGTPLGLRSSNQFVGTLQSGQARQMQIRVRVPADADAGSYELPVEIDYRDQGTPKNDEEEVRVRVDSQPRFEVVNSSTTAPVGGKGSVTVALKNVGDEVATESVVTLNSGSPDIAFGQSASAKRFVGEWKPGQVRRVTYDATVGTGADARSYTMQATVNYQDTDGIAGQSRTLSFGVEPLPEQTFSVTNVTSSLSVGQRGTLSGTITNTGSLTARNAVVVVKTDGQTVTPVGSEYAIGSLAPNESTEFTFDMRVGENTDAGPRQFTVQVRYRNADGDRLNSQPIDVPARVDAHRPEFEIRNTSSTLRVGEEGKLRGTVVNTGDSPVTNAVLVFQQPGGTVTPVETEYAIGDLAPGEATNFSFDADVSGSADAGPRQFSFRVRYRNADNVQQQSGAIDVRTNVARSMPEFDVEGLNTSVSAGGNGELRLRLTNTRDQTLSDISAKLYTESPISTSDSEAFVDELGPNESATVTFSVAAAGDATENKQYPVKLDFQYDEADGDTKMSDTYQVPVSVTDGGGGGGSLPIVAAVALLAVGGGLVYYRRR